MNNQIDLTATGNAADETQVHNLTYASRLKGLAWFIEIVLVPVFARRANCALGRQICLGIPGLTNAVI